MSPHYIPIDMLQQQCIHGLSLMPGEAFRLQTDVPCCPGPLSLPSKAQS